MHVPSLNQDFVSRFGLAPFYYTIIGFEASEVILGYEPKYENAQSNIKK